MRDHLMIKRDSLMNLKNKKFDDIRWYMYDSESIGDFEVWNIKVIFMPHYRENGEVKGVLLPTFYTKEDGSFAGLMMKKMVLPQYLLPFDGDMYSFLSAVYNIVCYALCEYRDPWSLDMLDRGFDSGNLDLNLHISDYGWEYDDIYNIVIFDEEREYYNMHTGSGCNAYIVVSPNILTRGDENWVPVPKDEFMKYHYSKYPEAYISTFTDYDYYDENDIDARMSVEQSCIIADIFNEFDKMNE